MATIPRTQFRFGLGLLCLCLLAGCSFDREWRQWDGYAHPADDITGRWEGRWHSEPTGHSGRLQAIVTNIDDDQYHVQYRAHFALVPPFEWIPFEFETKAIVERNGTNFHVEGQDDLGWLAGGVYNYSGQATSCEFGINYCADRDHGTFQMSRVDCCCSGCDSSGETAVSDDGGSLAQTAGLCDSE